MIKFPKYIQIETTILCNAECYFCPQNMLLRRPRDMEETVWKKIIDQSRDRGVIYRPFMVNEPLSDNKLPVIMNYIKQDSTAKVHLNSNAINLTEKWSKNLLESGLDLIKFSVDGYSPKSYSASGRGDEGKYNRVVNNILRFVELKNKLHHHVKIYVRMIDMPGNKDEQEAYLEFWSDKVDYAQIVPMYSWPWSGQEKPYLKPCPKIKNEMFFYVDGRATLCCWDNWERGIIGDINFASVEEIWTGAMNKHYRNLLNEGKRDKILLCSRCDAYKRYDFSNWEGYE